MAEYSKKFIEKEGRCYMTPDFSLIEEYDKLQEGEFVSLICEGLGFNGISKENGLCILHYNEIKNNYEIII